MQTILVLGAWGSGTTAVTGYIQRLGAYSCPPHWETNDLRTQDSYESLELRQLLTNCIDEITFKPLIPEHTIVFKQSFQKWLSAKFDEAKASDARAIVLKHPLLAFFLSEILEVCNPKLLVVTRSFQDIENTRIRRKWPANFGLQGANVVYSVIYGTLMLREQSFYTLSYKDLLNTNSERERIREYLAITESKENIARAEAWIRHN